MGCELEKEEFVEVLYEMSLGGERLGKWEQVRRLGVWSPQLPWAQLRPWFSKLASLLFLSILESAPRKQTEQGLGTS